MLTWIDTTLGRNQRVTDRRHYVIRYTPRTPRKFRFVNSTDLNVHVDDLRPDVEYEFSVKIVKGHRQSTWSLNVLNRTKEACKDFLLLLHSNLNGSTGVNLGQKVGA